MTTLEQTITEVDEAAALVAYLWGYNSKTLDAKPLAIQLKDRLEYGQMLLAQAERQGKTLEEVARIKRRIARLRQRYAAALEDPEDQRRCTEFEAAWQRYEQAIENYKEAWNAASEVEKAAYRRSTRGFAQVHETVRPRDKPGR